MVGKEKSHPRGKKQKMTREVTIRKKGQWDC